MFLPFDKQCLRARTRLPGQKNAF